jgi:fructosamine-3-kinase
MIQASSFIKKTTAEFDSTPVKSIRILHGGDVNQVYRVTTATTDYVFRLNKPSYIEEFRKEWYCYKEVAKHGIPTPKLYKHGTTVEYAYEIIGYVAPKKSFDKIKVWEKLGEYARACSQIKLLPERATDTAEHAALHFCDKYLAYDIGEMTSTDFLLNGKVYSSAQQQKILGKLKQIQDIKFEFGLVHGDINWGNFVVDKENIVYLIDWGSADIDLIPQLEILLVYKLWIVNKRINQEQFNAFLKGIGGGTEFTDKEQIESLLLLYLMDKLRWSHDQKEHTAYKDYLWQFKKLLKILEL